MNIFERVLENQEKKTLLKKLFYIILLVLAALEILFMSFLDFGHFYFSFEKIPAFGCILGFVSCILIIIISKVLGKVWLMKPEDYYDR